MSDDLLQGIRDALGEEENAKSDPQATMEKLLKAMEGMEGVTDEEKKSMFENLASGLLGRAGSKESQLPIGSPISNPLLEFAVLFGFISLIVLVFGLIGYKLYNNMIQREKKRELKKLQKQQKKKK